MLRRRLRLFERLRDHHRNRLADMARLVVRQQIMRADEDLGPVPAGQLHVVFCRRHGIMWDRPPAILETIRPGVDPQYPRHRHRLGHVDRGNPRVGMRRAHHRGPDLTGQTEIIGEPAAPSDETLVLVARKRSPDSLE